MAKRLSATHHARWMGSCIHILKMLVVSDVFTLSAQQQADILLFAFFIIYVHFYFWFSCTRMADVPYLMVQLHKDLLAWAARDPKGAKAAKKKADLHTEYLTGRSAILSLASDKVSDETKDAMVSALKGFPREWVVDPGKPDMPSVYEDSALEDFVSEESWLFFKLCKFDPTFLSKPAREWAADENYADFRKLVNSFSPVNDVAERAVKFASDFNGKITRNDKQHEGMMQGIEAHRRANPKPTKK